jgi:hypothetical protein
MRVQRLCNVGEMLELEAGNSIEETLEPSPLIPTLEV